MEQDVIPRDMTVCLSLPAKCLGGLYCEKCCKVVFLHRAVLLVARSASGSVFYTLNNSMQ